ncbi:imidazolonepropionase-like amidohydrolase [Leucobacter exalbidus]|uniref:Imidazolonepropionase-like amidohydrolase n=1 Tax=Leucobacter exalbidus TaxID=662960 RepID=A0A940PUA2_9MICO|nr:amidohydrolase [Leucobacter exalbidus]MBP1326938.1 imidazolonepropionase-like amidohydrolase [Leucobacter exalbidus]
MSESEFIIVGARTLTGAGEVFEAGAVHVNDGRIVWVGEEADLVGLPSDVPRVDATGSWLTPGLIDAHSHIGAHEDGNGWAGADASELARPNTAGVRIIDAVNTEDVAFADAIGGGVTTVVIKPGSGNPIGGRTVAIKTAGSRIIDDRVVRADVSVKSALGENPKRTYESRSQSPMTRLGTAHVIRQAMSDAQDYARRRASAEVTGDQLKVDLDLEALAAVLSGELLWDLHVHRHDDIATALRIADEFGLNVVLNHGTEAHKLAEVLARRDVPVIFGPILTTRGKVECAEADPANLARLSEAGVRIALTTDHPVVPQQYLALQGSIAIRAGLSWEAAMAAVTASPAQIARIDDRVGTLAPGLDADLVLWSGDPFDAASVVRAVFIEGQRVAGVGEGLE